jgi:dihydroorotate dehydrogenase (NAD+) catalytic subunit
VDRAVNLDFRIRDARFTSPIIGASGLFGYGSEYESMVDYNVFGAVVTKTVTLTPREGNPPPRIVDVGCGIINSIGLENVGSESFLGEILPEVHIPCGLIVSIGGGVVGEYGKLAGLIDGNPKVDALEINVSCPNIKEGGIAFGRSPKTTAEVISSVRSETDLPVIAKVPPLVSGIEEVCIAACDAGADAVTVANTYPAIAIDIDLAKPVLGGVSGGLSGHAIKPLSLLLVWKAARCVTVPIIASGGIESGADALEFILAGACAFQIGSVVLRDLSSPSNMLDALKTYMGKHGCRSLSDLVGVANTKEDACG